MAAGWCWRCKSWRCGRWRYRTIAVRPDTNSIAREPPELRASAPASSGRSRLADRGARHAAASMCDTDLLSGFKLWVRCRTNAPGGSKTGSRQTAFIPSHPLPCTARALLVGCTRQPRASRSNDAHIRESRSPLRRTYACAGRKYTHQNSPKLTPGRIPKRGEKKESGSPQQLCARAHGCAPRAMLATRCKRGFSGQSQQIAATVRISVCDRPDNHSGTPVSILSTAGHQHARREENGTADGRR